MVMDLKAKAEHVYQAWKGMYVKAYASRIFTYNFINREMSKMHEKNENRTGYGI